jgi:hypothetical protein
MHGTRPASRQAAVFADNLLSVAAKTAFHTVDGADYDTPLGVSLVSRWCFTVGSTDRIA